MADDRSTIEVRVNEVAQLFDTLDPNPFRERDLDREAEEYIVGWARELPRSSRIRIVVHMPKRECETEQGRELPRALPRYFQYRAEVTGRELKELFRIGWRSLLVGIAVLAICMTSGRMVTSMLNNSEFSRFAEEGFIILGWVANWRPLEIFLYDWWPIAGRRRLYERLASATVELVAD